MGSTDATTPSNPHTIDDATAAVDVLDVELAPADVWVLGQLLESGTASFPPEIEEEILTGYRILKSTGYEPPPVEGRTNVELDASIEDRETQPEPRPTPVGEPEAAREIVLAEVTSEEPTPPPGEVKLEVPEGLGEQSQHVAEAIDELRRELADTSITVNVDSPDAPTQPASRDEVNTEPAGADWGQRLDGAVVLAGLTTATLLAIGAATIPDPVFAALALVVLGVTAFLAYPYLANDDRGDSP